MACAGALSAVRSAGSGADRIWVTHGFTGPVVRWLRELGRDAIAVETRFEGERADLALPEPGVDATEAE